MQNNAGSEGTSEKSLRASSPSPTHLSRRRAIWARIVYLLLFALVGSSFVLGIPSRFEAHAAGVIGIYVRQNSIGEIVLLPINGMPAANAGLPNDAVLIAVDGTPIQAEIDESGVFQLLRGPPGRPVLLEIRAPDGRLRQYSITRAGFPLEEYGISTNAYAIYMVSIGVALVLASSIPALIIVLKKPEDWLAILASATILVVAIYNSAAYAGDFFLPPLLSGMIAFAYHFFVLIILYIFPDGRFIPRWTSRFLIVGLIWGLWKVLPISIASELWTSRAWIVIDLLVYGVGIYAQIYRYRNVSGPQERQQTKWITYGMVVAFLTQYAYYFPTLFVPEINSGTKIGVGFTLVGRTAQHLAMVVLPVAVIHAVMRRRLYEIDVIINRTVLYVLLSGIVAGVFAATISLTQRIFVAVTGQKSDLAYILSTLVIVTIVTPAKDFLQDKVKKWFKEPPFHERKLNAFKESVQMRMSVVDVNSITCRFLEEAIKAFDAEGGVAFLEKKRGSKPIQTAGDWKGEAEINIPVTAGETTIAGIRLGARRDGRGYSIQNCELLYEVAAVVGRAIEEDKRMTR